MDLGHFITAAVIGLIEGLTEFIPVSSTAHIAVAQRFLRFDDPGQVFNVTIQLGAIAAVCWHFRERLWRTTTGVVGGDPGARWFAAMVALACLPAVLIGIPADKFLEQHVFTDTVAMPVIAATWAVGGLAILIIERRRHRDAYADNAALPWQVALGIGFCQLLALLPGVSRSGATILGALLIGVARPAATEFSFFLAIPILLGAAVLKLIKHHQQLTADRALDIGVGAVFAFVSALIVVRWLIRFVSNHDFTGFAWYRMAAGLILAALLACGLLR